MVLRRIGHLRHRPLDRQEKMRLTSTNLCSPLESPELINKFKFLLNDLKFNLFKITGDTCADVE